LGDAATRHHARDALAALKSEIGGILLLHGGTITEITRKLDATIAKLGLGPKESK